MNEDPDQPRMRPAVLVAALVVVAVSAAIVILATRSGDGAPGPDGAEATAPTAPVTVLDELFPDSSADSAEPEPTADPAGASAAASTILPIETGWTSSAYGDVEVLALLRNAGDLAFANVNVELILVDADGDVLATIPASYGRVEPGQVLPVTSFTTAPIEEIADITLDVSARGTLAPASGLLGFDEVEWEQDELGTVTVTGMVVAPNPTDFVTVIAVLRDAAGAYAGSAFGFVESVDADGREFEAFGFPATEVADIELYTAS